MYFQSPGICKILHNAHRPYAPQELVSSSESESDGEREDSGPRWVVVGHTSRGRPIKKLRSAVAEEELAKAEVWESLGRTAMHCCHTPRLSSHLYCP
jgi:hypothetical protein